MLRFPGGVFYSPADLGFEVEIIPAATTVNGKIVPWNFYNAGWKVALSLFRVSGMQAVTVETDLFDETAQNVLFNRSLWATVNADAVAITDGISSNSTGGGIAAGPPVLFAAPYLRFNLNNTAGSPTTALNLRVWVYRQSAYTQG